MTTRGAEKVANGGTESAATAAAAGAFEPSFLEALVPALPALRENRTKLICNAGAADTRKLAETVKKLAPGFRVAWVEGDECLEQIQARLKAG
jgi:hypothetical protein